ncbi:uncharacterized protein LY89DRAFT_688619 [Mollisia scopiformis]|uniref:Uncharacterized protein n=1 Tax=Mollisia scopiformis TaxID=149040 RepID=A0A194WW18_MOLSC|nr:uncharacterized protein LY89DRAFT_688619 [Mollisia scopiformis]KUJ12158.1 hypothetical protein LY89DRAFT_688619 [Mollisia scopiformis]
MAQNGNIVQGAVADGVTGPRIVVGIDYGTSNTELAWAQTDGSAKNSMADLGSDLVVFKFWPGSDNPRVPSAISYSPTNPDTRRSQWGWSIDDDSKVLKWTKLELEPQSTKAELDQLRELTKGLDLLRELRESKNEGLMTDVPQHITKSAEDIVRDFLTKVSRVWYKHMKSQNQFVLEQVPLDLVITHPATWKYEAMNKTFRAAMGAFHSGMFPTIRNVSFASEPESWALYTIQNLLAKGHDVLIPGECFILCDAGGGTVDLVSYRVNKVDPLELHRIGNITGDKCGGTFIDKAFLDFLAPRLANLDIDPETVGTGGHMVFKPRSRVLLERFERIKHAFTGTGDASLTLPRGTKVVAGYEDSIVNGVLTLTEQDLKKMFSKSVNGTLGLLQRQMTRVMNTKYKGIPCQVTNIIMAGGFSESEYLFNQVKAYANKEADVEVQRADDCWIGIVKGAVLRGMGVGMAPAPAVIPCPRHYGICVSHRYEEWNNIGERTVDDSFHGQRMVPDHLSWLVRQGDAILPFEPIQTRFGVRCKFTKQQYDLGSSVRITFVASSIMEPPSTMAGLSRAENEVIYLDVESTMIPKSFLQKQSKSRGGSYLTADLEVVFEISDRVYVSVQHHGEVLANVDTNL